MKAFEAVVAKEHENDTRLGMPSIDLGHSARRMTAMENMTGGNGFRQPPAEVKVRANGKTRGDMKREAMARANAAVSETRAPQFMHSYARQRAI